jgi:hypothetical protein
MARSTQFSRSPTTGVGSARHGGQSEDTNDSEFDDLPQRPRGRSVVDDPEWHRIGTLTAGLAIGLLLGAGVALLTTPVSGDEARALIGQRTRRLKGRAADRWDDLRDDLRRAARRSRRNLRRSLTRGRWTYEDALDRW